MQLRPTSFKSAVVWQLVQTPEPDEDNSASTPLALGRFRFRFLSSKLKAHEHTAAHNGDTYSSDADARYITEAAEAGDISGSSLLVKPEDDIQH